MKHTKTKIKLICLLLAASTLLSLSGCGESSMSESMVFAMDTEMTIIAYGNKRKAGIDAAEAVITSLDSMLDPSLPTSATYAINHANGEKVVVPGQVAQMLAAAQTVYSHSKGAFDLTLYPVIRLWGFTDGKYYVPTDQEILDELTKLCFDKLVLTSFPATGTYTVSLPAGGELSFASCAKGCTSANAIEAMKNAGVTSGFVSLGGNVQTLGTKYDGSNWNVGIKDPNNTSSFLGVLGVGETAVITSGSYERFFTQNKKTYHHLFKPTTGYPVSNSLLSVTIICPDGTMADCLSTALFILGETQALNYWRTYGKTEGGGFEMVLVTNDNRVICTSGLIEAFTLSNDSYKLSFTE